MQDKKSKKEILNNIFVFLKNKFKRALDWWLKRKDKKPIILILISSVFFIYSNFFATSSGSVLASKVFQPNADGEVSYGDKVRVIIPRDLFDTKQEISISSVPTLPKRNIDDAELLASYDISIGDLHQFEKEIIVELNYDPKDISEDDVKNGRIIASYFDTEKDSWISLPTKVDVPNHKVKFSTRHLCITVLEKLINDIYPTDHFVILYSAKNISADSEINNTQWKKRGGGSFSGVIYASEVPDYIVDMGYFLETALLKYSDAKFTSPIVSKPSEILGEDAKMVIKVDSNYLKIVNAVFGSAAIYDKLDGRIHIPTATAWTPQELKLTTAHELFHAVQNRYFNAAQMSLRKWWIESSADYAAYKFVWNGENVKFPPVSQGGDTPKKNYYFTTSITTTDNTHEYTTAYFIDYLVSRGVNFKEMWDELAKADWSNLADIVYPLSEFLKSRGYTDLATQYGEFAKKMFFDASSPFNSNNDEKLKDKIPPEMVQKWVIFKDADKIENNYDIAVASSYSAGVMGILTEGNSRKLKLEINGDLPAYTHVFVYKLKGDKRTSAELLGNFEYKINSVPIDVVLEKDSGLYVLVTNTGTSNATVSVKLSEPNLKITSVEPKSGIVGKKITIKGSGFGKEQGTSELLMGQGNTVKEIISWKDDAIELLVPRFAASYPNPIVIKMKDGQSASIDFSATDDPLGYVKNTTGWHFSISAAVKKTDGTYDGIVSFGSNTKGLKWEGNNFKYSYINGSISQTAYGTLSPDGKQIDKVVFQESRLLDPEWPHAEHHIHSFTAINIPLKSAYDASVSYELTGDVVKSLVSDVVYEGKTESDDSYGIISHEYKFDSLNWNNPGRPLDKPSISVSFFNNK